MPPRLTPTVQGRIIFGVVPGSAVAASAGANVNVDDNDDEEFREDLDGEYYDRVFGGEDSDSDMNMSDDDM